MIAEIIAPGSLTLSGDVSLPASKSISNRVLIIRSIGGLDFEIINLSASNDTQQLNHLLQNPSSLMDAGEGGTTLRFLLAFMALRGEEVTITAAPSLRKRPVTELVEALRSMGSIIEYNEEEGRLPLTIRSSKLSANEVTIRGDISSQFISALMMIGPYIKGGLQINITGEILSVPYIEMTISVMRYFGIAVNFQGSHITIPEGNYEPRNITIEPDWSAASYWYEAAALSSGAEILLHKLNVKSLQGDAVVAEMMKSFGVETISDNDGIIIRKQKGSAVTDYFTADFSGCPDLGTAIGATAGGLNVTADLEGLKNFRLKESDRAVAMQRGLYNLNVKTDFCGGSKLKIYSGSGIRFWSRPISTYHDHRIAMAFAPLALRTGTMLIEEPQVVNKSYPGYWDDLKRLGFEVRQMKPDN